MLTWSLNILDQRDISAREIRYSNHPSLTLSKDLIYRKEEQVFWLRCNLQGTSQRKNLIEIISYENNYENIKNAAEQKQWSGRGENHSKISTDLVRIPLLIAYIISLLIIVSVLGEG